MGPGDGLKKEIEAGRRRDRMAKEGYFETADTTIHEEGKGLNLGATWAQNSPSAL